MKTYILHTWSGGDGSSTRWVKALSYEHVRNLYTACLPPGIIWHIEDPTWKISANTTS